MEAEVAGWKAVSEYMKALLGAFGEWLQSEQARKVFNFGYDGLKWAMVVCSTMLLGLPLLASPIIPVMFGTEASIGESVGQWQVKRDILDETTLELFNGNRTVTPRGRAVNDYYNGVVMTYEHGDNIKILDLPGINSGHLMLLAGLSLLPIILLLARLLQEICERADAAIYRHQSRKRHTA